MTEPSKTLLPVRADFYRDGNGNMCWDRGQAEFVTVKEYERVCASLSEAMEWSDEDKPLPEDEAIHAAHPLQTKDYDTYSEALRLVGAKRSKYALVDLVNWLLRQRGAPK